MAVYQTIIKLVLALILGGLIGYEREHMSRPAGLRTHVIVCMGAALVQMTSIDFYALNPGIFNTDPMRLGAQVISGIGFLGAGTIIKEGASIKGLTTAASIWTVAGIGLAIGSGLYMDAILATVFIYAALKGLRKVELYMSKGKKSTLLQILVDDSPGRVGEIGDIFGSMNINITNVEMQSVDEETVSIEFTLLSSSELPFTDILDRLTHIRGVKDAVFL